MTGDSLCGVSTRRYRITAQDRAYISYLIKLEMSSTERLISRAGQRKFPDPDAELNRRQNLNDRSLGHGLAI